MDNKVIEQAINLKKTKGRIDVIDIANSLGIKVYSTKKIQYPSMIAHNKETGYYEIYFNENEKKTRNRFSIAHEIAHYILHKSKIIEFGVVGRENLCSLSSSEELEADKLAAEILMPCSCVNEFMEHNEITRDVKIELDMIKKVAKEFETSLLATIMRLRELGYYVGYIEL